MLAQDIRFDPFNRTIVTLIETLKHNGIKYDRDSKVDVGIIEFALLRCEFDKVILQQTGWTDADDKPTFRVLKGHGFIHTLDYYIVQDNIMEGFIILTEYNGTRYSEMPRNHRRRIEETYVNMSLEASYSDDVDTIMKRYNEVLKNMD